ncbi:NAD(P)-dependent oxidoreductase [Streptomyces sp. NPDC090442]|uniref:NAD(P)-dependent oxidoreductase n=1 Tax=Streptomyces sp. NPDC090442 TaxID=3365962 RepID=UPI0038100747
MFAHTGAVRRVSIPAASGGTRWSGNLTLRPSWAGTWSVARQGPAGWSRLRTVRAVFRNRGREMPYVAQDRPRVGWIGTGRMGFQLAARLLEAGHDVAVYNRTRAKAEPLAERGAAIVDRPVDLADRDVVFSMVSASPDLEAVTTGPSGVLTSPDAAPSVLVDSSTVSTETSALIRHAAAKRGADFLAAPVSGNPKVIAAGKLTVAVSGSREAFGQVEPLLALLGRGVTYVGEGEVARLVKIAHNVFLGVVTQSLAEITVLAEKGGVSRDAFLEFLNDSVMGSLYTRYKSPAVVNLDFTPTFTMPLLRKDFDLGLSAARELEVPMPLAAATAQLIAGAIGAGHVEEDFAALILEQARNSGITLEPQNTPVDDGLSPNS